jgi:murein DD-endopeptidase MepM/ murein hydrolase activator NlpD
MKTVARILLVTFGLSVLAVTARPYLERAWFIYTLAIEEPSAALPSPLTPRRAYRLVDSWGNARSDGRRHEGIDIFAAKDTPVVTTTRGIVTRVGTNHLGGQVVWVLGPGLERHYYAHLNRYGGFREGDRVEAGDIIGYAGNTGNARGGPVHLHYGIYRQGAQNPYPRLAAGLTLRHASVSSDLRTPRRGVAPRSRFTTTELTTNRGFGTELSAAQRQPHVRHRRERGN